MLTAVVSLVIWAGVVLLFHQRGGKQPGLLHGPGRPHSPVEHFRSWLYWCHHDLKSKSVILQQHFHASAGMLLFLPTFSSHVD